MAPMFPLVVVVHADEETRVDAARSSAGWHEADARARIAAQATEEQRRAIADVLLDNSGIAGRTGRAGARHLVSAGAAVGAQHPHPRGRAHRRRSWCRTTRRGRTMRGGSSPGSTWPVAPKALRVDHIGSTAVPGMDAKDVIDVQVTVESLDVADELADALADVGYPAHRGHHQRRAATTAIRRCGASGFTEPRIPGGRPTSMFGWTAGPTSSSRCCSSTG